MTVTFEFVRPVFAKGTSYIGGMFFNYDWFFQYDREYNSKWDIETDRNKSGHSITIRFWKCEFSAGCNNYNQERDIRFSQGGLTETARNLVSVTHFIDGADHLKFFNSEYDLSPENALVWLTLSKFEDKGESIVFLSDLLEIPENIISDFINKLIASEYAELVNSQEEMSKSAKLKISFKGQVRLNQAEIIACYFK